MSLRSRILEVVAGVPSFVALLGRLMIDRRVSVADRAIVAAAVLYAFSPVDLVPDFIPVLGQLDDLYLIALAVDRMLRRADPEVVRAHWTRSPDLLDAFEGSLEGVARRLPQSIERELTAAADRR